VYWGTGWRRLIGSPKLQIIFHQRATKYRSLLWKMTYKDKGSYGSSPPCTLCWRKWGYLFWFAWHNQLSIAQMDGLLHSHDSFTWLCSCATHCDTLQRTATHCNALQPTATHCNALQHTATHTVQMNGLLHSHDSFTALAWLIHVTLVMCNTLQHTATHCNTPQCTRYRWMGYCTRMTHSRDSVHVQHTATHRNALQHTTTHTVQRNGLLNSHDSFTWLSLCATHCNTPQHTETPCNAHGILKTH